MGDPEISIVVVSYNCSALLVDCLDSLRGGIGGVSAEVIIVDSGSADDSADAAKRHAVTDRVIRSASNLGFARGNNLGIAAAGGRFVVLLNPDTVVRPRALERLYAFMCDNPGAGYCGPRLVNADGTHQASARRFPTPLSSFYSLCGLDHRAPNSTNTLNLHWSQGDRTTARADWLSGACLMLRSECLRSIGGLDEGFFLYFEETDLCVRASQKGWEGWYVPDAEVMHLGGGTVDVAVRDKAFSGDHPVHWVRSGRRYMRKHWGLSGLWISIGLQLLAYSGKWARNRMRFDAKSKAKADWAAKSIGYLLAVRGERR